MPRLFSRPARTTSIATGRDRIATEIERLNRLSDYDLCKSGTDRVTLGGQVLRALHAM